MATLKPSSKITVRFALTKGDGEYPGVDEFSKKEVIQPLSFTKFVLTWDDEVAEAEGLTKDLIKDCLVLYDGVSKAKDGELGLYFEEGELSGYPSPVIEFRLKKAIEPESFVKCVWTSSVVVQPASRKNAEVDPFIFEDHSGYTTALNGKETKSLIETLENEGVYSGKYVDVEQLEAGISCLEMS